MTSLFSTINIQNQKERKVIYPGRGSCKIDVRCYQMIRYLLIVFKKLVFSYLENAEIQAIYIVFLLNKKKYKERQKLKISMQENNKNAK